jgi:two-component system cell cycle sensor histidine kinase/response regulator CckA
MTFPLHIIHLEDDPDDAEMVRRALRKEGIDCRITVVKAQNEFRKALAEEEVHLILSDFSMPTFDGLSALKITREIRPEVPFVFLSGTIGEETAIMALKEGAADYVIKDRMARLGASVRRALSDAERRAEQAQNEKALRESRERLAAQAELLDHTKDAIWVCDLQGTVTYWNKGAEAIFGWKASEAVGQGIAALFFPTLITDSGNHIEQALAEGQWTGEMAKSGKEKKELWVQSRWSLMRDSNGAPLSILIVESDITEQKRIEDEALRNQRIRMLGALAGGIAHDLNNMLAPVLMGISLLSQEPLTQEGRKMLEVMHKSAQRGSKMVTQILSFSRGIGGESMSVDVKHLVADIVEFARKTFPHSIEFRTRVSDEPHVVKGNPTQLHQVLLNLLVNARDAMNKGGVLTVECVNTELTAESLPPEAGSKPGRYVRLTVMDTGHGIPTDILKKIFEPFFTTKPQDQGTGLGLSTVVGIVKTHGGFLDVSSEVGRGSVFIVYLPAESGAG